MHLHELLKSITLTKDDYLISRQDWTDNRRNVSHMRYRLSDSGKAVLVWPHNRQVVISNEENTLSVEDLMADDWYIIERVGSDETPKNGDRFIVDYKYYTYFDGNLYLDSPQGFNDINKTGRYSILKIK